MLVTFSEIFTSTRLLHHSKAAVSMLVIWSGITISVNSLQLANMPQLILVKLEESVTLDNPHDSNAQPPTVVTLSGISILVKLLHPKNARKLICCTLFGILTFCKLLQPANASLPITVIPSSILTCRTDNSSQGAEPPFPKFSISPVPEIVSTPFSSSVHVTFSPQVPLSTMLSPESGSYATHVIVPP